MLSSVEFFNVVGISVNVKSVNNAVNFLLAALGSRHSLFIVFHRLEILFYLLMLPDSVHFKSCRVVAKLKSSLVQGDYSFGSATVHHVFVRLNQYIFSFSLFLI